MPALSKLGQITGPDLSPRSSDLQRRSDGLNAATSLGLGLGLAGGLLLICCIWWKNCVSPRLKRGVRTGKKPSKHSSLSPAPIIPSPRPTHPPSSHNRDPVVGVDAEYPMSYTPVVGVDR
ncbi:hypothetical protein BBP40_005965 [Aspergillus hancockii]|nr:hypothetical protein BBP40_005965 [Aspergillus hancockii]